MSLIEILLPAVYQLSGLLLTLYAGFVLLSVLLFLRNRGRGRPFAAAPAQWPHVTVQLPIYNEPRVATRLLAAVAALDYPRDRLHIQVLDDSTDKTTAQVRGLAGHLRRSRGMDIHYQHRSQRQGYKAGALAAALPQAVGEFIAIFDADFRPPPDWLRRALPPLLADPGLAFVQTRWDHLNRGQNSITAAQSLALDGHFVVEQHARTAAGLWQNFNGSAGIWRRAAILDAGGWQQDTVTEDLDLSYRAQLRGWRGAYLDQVAAPAELPPLLSSYKRQQRRWAKGSAQTLRKLAPALWRSNHPWPLRVHALLHLSAYATHLPLLALLLLTLPFALLPSQELPLPMVGAISSLLSIAPFLMYGLARYQLGGRGGLRSLWALPLLALISIGLSPTVAGAVIDGLLHGGGAFERTPKQGNGARLAALPEGLTVRDLLPEALTLAYALITVAVALLAGAWALLPLPLLYTLGSGLVLRLSLGEWLDQYAVCSGQYAVFSGQYAVVSYQLSVIGGRWRTLFKALQRPIAPTDPLNTEY